MGRHKAVRFKAGGGVSSWLRLTAFVVAMILTVAGALVMVPSVETASAADLPAPRAETLTKDMIDGFSLQVKRAEPADSSYEDVHDGDHVSVYDTLRYKLDFHVPQGTLGADHNTLSAYVKMNGSTDFPAMSCTPAEQYGNIIINGEESGAYSVRLMNAIAEGKDSLGSSTSDDVYSSYCGWDGNNGSQNGMVSMRLRVVLTFNDEMVARNQNMDITDGVLTFDQAAYYLADGGKKPILNIGESDDSTQIYLDRMHVDLSKETIGASHFDDATGLVIQKFRVTIRNDGDLDLPAGWKIGDTMFENDAPQSKMDARGSVKSFGFACAPNNYTNTVPSWGRKSSWDSSKGELNWWKSNRLTSPDNYCGPWSDSNYTWMVTPTQQYHSWLSSPKSPRDYSQGSPYVYWNDTQSEFYDKNPVFKKGDVLTYEYTGYTPYREDLSHWTNRVSLNPNTEYYPELITADARVDSPPDYEHVKKPYIVTEKVQTKDETINCKAGAEGCLSSVHWEYRVRNIGDGDQNGDWEVKDQLNYWSGADTGTNYSWFTQDDMDRLVNALSDQKLNARITKLAFDKTHNLTQNNKNPDGTSITAPPLEWVDFTSWDAVSDRMNARDLVGYVIHVTTPIKVGQVITVPYTSTAPASWVSDQPSSTKTVRNFGQYCDGSDCRTVTQAHSDRTLSIPTIYKACAGYSFMTDKPKPDSLLGRCDVRLTVPDVYQDNKVFTFKEKMTPTTIQWYQGDFKASKSPNSFYLSGDSFDRSQYWWILESPKEIGDSTSKIVADDSVRVTITKDSTEDWTISFEILKPNNYYGANQKYLNYYINYREGDFDTDAYTILDADANARSIALENAVHAVVGDKINEGVSTGVSTSDFGARYTENQDYSRGRKTLKSNSPSGASGSRSVYRVGLNPKAKDLDPNSDTVSFVDFMQPLPDNVSVNLDLSSVKIKASKTPNNSQWTGPNYAGESRLLYYSGNNNNYMQTDSVRRVSYSYSRVDNMKSDPAPDAVDVPVTADQISYDTNTRTLKITGLPDGQRIWVEYALMFNSTSEDSHDVLVQNGAKLTHDDGSLIDGMVTESYRQVTIYHSSAVAKISGVFLDKYDASHPDLRVGGAKYQLDEWDGSKWVKNRDVTTSKTDAIAIDHLVCGTAYRIYETEAPANYVLDDAKHGFYLKSCGVESGLMPTGFKDDPANRGLIVMDHLTLTDKHELLRWFPLTGRRELLWIASGLGVILLGGATVLITRRRKSQSHGSHARK